MLIQPNFSISYTISEYVCLSSKCKFPVVAQWIYMKAQLKTELSAAQLNILAITGNYALSGQPHLSRKRTSLTIPSLLLSLFSIPFSPLSIYS